MRLVSLILFALFLAAMLYKSHCSLYLFWCIGNCVRGCGGVCDCCGGGFHLGKEKKIITGDIAAPCACIFFFVSFRMSLYYNKPNLWNYGSRVNLDSIILSVAPQPTPSGPLILSPIFTDTSALLAWWQSNPTGVARWGGGNATITMPANGTLNFLENTTYNSLTISTNNGNPVITISQEYITLIYEGTNNIIWTHA